MPAESRSPGLLKKLADWRQIKAAEAFAARYRREAPPPPEGLQIPDIFGYIHYKAFRYLKQGPATYRKRDFFGMPPAEWPPEALAAIKRGCEQIVQWKGLSPESALENVGIEGFYATLEIFHFKLNQQSALHGGEGIIIDEMRMEHVVDGRIITLYNKVEILAPDE